MLLAQAEEKRIRHREQEAHNCAPWLPFSRFMEPLEDDPVCVPRTA